MGGADKIHFERRTPLRRKFQMRPTQSVKAKSLTLWWMESSAQVNLGKLCAHSPCWRYSTNPDHLQSHNWAEAGQNLILRSIKNRPCYSSASSHTNSNKKYKIHISLDTHPKSRGFCTDADRKRSVFKVLLLQVRLQWNLKHALKFFQDAEKFTTWS